jgi:hypothetical protein
MHPTPDDTINILLIGVMGRYCRYGLTQWSITWQQVGCIPCTTSFLASMVHKMHPTPDDTINILLIGVMGRYCRYGLTQRSITWQQVGCIPCTTSFWHRWCIKCTLRLMTQSQPRTDVLSEKRIARERCAVYRVYAGVILETIDSCADVTPQVTPKSKRW